MDEDSRTVFLVDRLNELVAFDIENIRDDDLAALLSKRVAVAAPIPRAPPMTTTVRPTKRRPGSKGLPGCVQSGINDLSRFAALNYPSGVSFAGRTGMQRKVG